MFPVRSEDVSQGAEEHLLLLLHRYYNFFLHEHFDFSTILLHIRRVLVEIF
jgi:hypothetical protein